MNRNLFVNSAAKASVNVKVKRHFNTICALSITCLTSVTSYGAIAQESVAENVSSEISSKAQHSSPQNILTSTINNNASKVELMTKLHQLEFFSANFSQQVLTESGELVEQSTGKLALSKPNLANWQVLTPDELSIVSDGKSVWFHDPWIEQVNVYSLATAIAQTPILLLTSKDDALWAQYNVTQQQPSAKTEAANKQERYVISAIDNSSQIKSLTLIFNSAMQGGQLSEFSFLDVTGQVSHITLSDFDTTIAPSQTLFDFVVPAGTQIDDQR